MEKKHLKHFSSNSILIYCWILLFSCSDSTSDRSDLILSQSSVVIDEHLKLEGNNAVIIQSDQNPYLFKIRPTGLNFKIKLFSNHCQKQKLNFQLNHFYRGPYQKHQWFYYLENYPVETEVISEILDPFLQLESNQNQKYELSPSKEIFIKENCVMGDCVDLDAKAWQLEIQTQPYFAQTIALSDEGQWDDLVQESPKTACVNLSNQNVIVEHQFEQKQVKKWVVLSNLLSLNMTEFDLMLEKIRALGVDFLVINGDFVSEEVLDRIDRFALPWFATLGDRDLGHLSLFMKTVGSTATAFDFSVVRLILLDTVSKTLSKTQYSFLENALDAVYFDQEDLDPLYQQKPLIKIVMSHIPPMSEEITDEQFDYQIDSARTIQLAKKQNVDIWLSSHNHKSSTKVFYHNQHDFSLVQQGKIGEFLLFELQEECLDGEHDGWVVFREENACVRYQVFY